MAGKKEEKDIDKLAVVYARYSSHGQKEQSIEGQIAAAKAYAEARGYTIIHEYVDRAMTGRNDNRDEFQRMLSDTAKKQFRVIILWKVDRFGRNREEITFNKYRCKKNGVRVEYVAESVPDSPEGVILESVLEGMAEYYSLQLAQNVKRGIYESAKKHHVIGGKAPLGYLIGENKEFVIDPKTAPVVKQIYDMYASGATTTEITTVLNQKGYRTSLGKKFTKNGLNTILKNEKYIGRYKYKDLIDDKDAIPAIVDKEIFYKVQDMLKVNKRMPSHKWSYSDYLLTDKLFCGKCGSPMVGESGFGKLGVKYNYYNCIKKRREKSCDKKTVRADWLEELVINQIIKEILSNDETIEWIVNTTWDYYLSIDTDQERIRAQQAQLEEVERAINNLVRAIEMGIMNEATVNRMKELETQKTALVAAIAENKLQKGFKLEKKHIDFFIRQFKGMDFDDRTCQHRLIDVFVNSIYLYDDRIKIVFNFGGDSATLSLNDLETAEMDEKGFVCSVPKSALTITSEPRIMWFSGVFIVSIKIPERS